MITQVIIAVQVIWACYKAKMISEKIRDVIGDSIKKHFGDDKLVSFALDLPKNPEHGDYATNVAMLLAKPLSKPPRTIAEILLPSLIESRLIEKAEIAGPGFINLTIKNEALQDVIAEILEAGSDFGKFKPNHQRVLVEFVSANPTGPIHLGHARSAFMGDAIARLLVAAGFDVEREFYVNDAGNQIRTLGRTIFARYSELCGREITLAKDAYPGEYVIDIAKTLRSEDGDVWLDKAESEYLPRCIEIGVRENLKSIRETLALAGIEFDNWYHESTLHDSGKLKQIVADYEQRNMLYQAEQAMGTDDKIRREESKAAQYAHQQLGGTFLKTSQYGDDEDRILLRQNGEPVYLVADLAYHQDKYARGYDRIIDVFGADHSGHLPRIRAAMRALELDDAKLEFVVVQIVRLLKDGQEVKISKRSGQIYLLSDLFEEVGTDVSRFIFLMRSAHTQFDFDLDLALKQSSDNPVFYVQYGHARMATLLKRGEFKSLDKKSLHRLNLPEERHILKKMSAFPDTVFSAAVALEPHRILYFCQELIAEFHSYFTRYKQSERIISDDVELTGARLAMVAALKQTIHNALSLLAISAPDYMDNK